jgi:hypothetical protein
MQYEAQASRSICETRWTQALLRACRRHRLYEIATSLRDVVCWFLHGLCGTTEARDAMTLVQLVARAAPLRRQQPMNSFRANPNNATCPRLGLSTRSFGPTIWLKKPSRLESCAWHAESGILYRAPYNYLDVIYLALEDVLATAQQLQSQ